jgi:hypothetical protein
MNLFFNYIKNPIYPESFEKINWGRFFLMFWVYLLFGFSLGIIGLLTAKLVGITRLPINFSIYQKIIYAIILAPILEEMLLRLLLVFTKKNLVIFIVVLTIISIIYLLRGKQMFLAFAILVSLSSILYLYHSRCYSFLKNHYRIFFYLSAIIFGLLHIFNFTGINWNNFIFTPLLVLPQLFVGLILGYIRTQYGFKYGVLFHAMINLAILL